MSEATIVPQTVKSYWGVRARKSQATLQVPSTQMLMVRMVLLSNGSGWVQGVPSLTEPQVIGGPHIPCLWQKRMQGVRVEDGPLALHPAPKAPHWLSLPPTSLPLVEEQGCKWQTCSLLLPPLHRAFNSRSCHFRPLQTRPCIRTP